MVEIHISNAQLERNSHISVGLMSRLSHNPNCRIDIINKILEGLNCHMLDVIIEIVHLPKVDDTIKFNMDMVSYNNVFKYIKYYYENRYSDEILRIQMNANKNYHLTCYRLTSLANHLNMEPLYLLYDLIVKYPEYSKA